MSFSPRNFHCAVLVVMFCTVSGCLQSSSEVASAKINVSLVNVSATTPLTQQEVKDFLTVVDALPNQSIPPFLASPSPLPKDQQGVRQYVADLQQHFRQRLDTQIQADAWAHDPEYAATFEALDVDPAAFCSLVSRVSCAWSARSVGQKLPIAVTRHRLQSQLQELMISLESSRQPLTQFERDQLRQGIQETVALSEFIVLMDAIPTESIQAVDQFAAQLTDILPDSTSVAAFEKRFESTAQIMQVGHTH